MTSASALPLTRPAAPADRTAMLRDCGLLVLLFAVFLVLRPLRNVPFIDDAVYAWSVQWLLEHGQFRVLEYSHINPVQIVWGSLFCLPGGFSFTALRFSNWVLGASTLCSVYLMLRELEVPRKASLAGAAALAVTPIFVILSCSFMTDIPLLAMATWASYALILAVRRQSDRWLWTSAFFSACACGIRIPGAVLPIATGCVLLFNAGRWGRRPDRLLAAAIPLGLFALLMLLSPSFTQATVDVSGMKNSLNGRLYLLTYVFGSLHTTVPTSLMFLAATAGVCLFPLALGMLHRPLLRRAGAVLLVLLAAWLLLYLLGHSPFQPLSAGQTWELEELGATADLVPGRDRSVYPPAVMLSVLVMGLLSSAVLFASAFWRRSVPGEAALRWQCLGHLLLLVILWLIYDRYILPFLPLLIVLTLVGTPRPRMLPFLAGMLLLFAVSIAGLHDHLAYNRALWASIASLRDRGVAPASIDAGYSANLWLHYAHPADAPRDPDGKAFVPHMTSRQSVRHRVANSPLPGYTVVERVPVSRWMGRDLFLYVLLQVPEAAPVPADPGPAADKW